MNIIRINCHKIWGNHIRKSLLLFLQFNFFSRCWVLLDLILYPFVNRAAFVILQLIWVEFSGLLNCFSPNDSTPMISTKRVHSWVNFLILRLRWCTFRNAWKSTDSISWDLNIAYLFIALIQLSWAITLYLYFVATKLC